MKKYIGLLTILLSLLLSFNVQAGQWIGESQITGWKYLKDDGTYATNEWFQDTDGNWYYFNESGMMEFDRWIDGKYYVDHSGKMLHDTITPDGYRVGSDGAWIPDTAASSQKGSLTFDQAVDIVKRNFLGTSTLLDEYTTFSCNHVSGEPSNNTIYITEDILSAHYFTSYDLTELGVGIIQGSRSGMTDLAKDISDRTGKKVRIALIIRYNYEPIATEIFNY